MLSKARAGAVLVSPTLWFIDAKQLAALALKHREPTIHNLRQFAEADSLSRTASALLSSTNVLPFS
jgi:hypothetical protein